MISRKPDALVNKKHPQYNKVQNYNQQLSANLNWLNFQLTSAVGNISRAARNISNSPKLQKQEQQRLSFLIDESLRLTRHLELLRLEVADFNKNKIGVD